MSARIPSLLSTAILAMLVLIAAALRWAAAANPLWLDEIWSLQLLERVTSPWEILTAIHHDNNHYLNTLGMYLAGSDRAWVIYRLPAVISGVLTVAAAGWVAAERGRSAQLIVMLLICCSYLLVHYASEARGYAPAVLFAVLAYGTMSRFLTFGTWRWSLAFAASAMLGLLSHLMFVHVYGAAICWSVAAISEHPGPARRRAWDLVRLHAGPIGVMGLLYWYDIRHLEFGGGPEYSLLPLVLQTSSLAVGGPLSGWLAGVFGLLFVGGTWIGLGLLRRAGNSEIKFLLLVLLLPIIQIVVARPQFMFVRYFLFAIVFGLLLSGYALAELARRGIAARVICAGLLLLFLGGNLVHYGRLLAHGRGQYLTAMEFMAAREPDSRLTVSGDHNHGIRKLLEFYSKYLTPIREVVYYDADDWPDEGPGWLILHQYGDHADDPFQEEYTVEGHLYRRQRVFETAILSGWRWHCYQRQPG